MNNFLRKQGLKLILTNHFLPKAHFFTIYQQQKSLKSPKHLEQHKKIYVKIEAIIQKFT